jgi:caa(3)-type oxidase subunit IV
MQAQPAKTFDPNDPHGFADLGEHHITSTRMLVVVILTLVVLTALTVFASSIETYLVKEMGWSLPEWVNIAVAMSIALVKGALVLSIFMALRYENPLYTIVFLFCMFAFALFLGLTGLDLDNRGHVYEWKAPAIDVGGTGVNMAYPGGTIHVHGETVEMPAGSFSGSLAEHLRDTYIKQTGITQAEYERRWAQANHYHPHQDNLPSADRSIARTGLSGALDETAPDHDDHGGH